jgi:NADPH2:quinone reductase
MNAAFIFESIFFGSAAILLSRIFKGKTRKTMFVVGVIHVIGLFLLAIFHQQPIVDSNYQRLVINIVSGGLGILAGNLIVIIASTQWKRLFIPSWFGWLSIILNSMSIICLFFLFGNDSVPGGIRERISIYSFVYWQIIAGLILLLTNQKNKKADLQAPTNKIKDTYPSPFTATEVILPGVVEPTGLLIKDRILNDPPAGQVIVKVEVSGISFAEKSMRLNKYPGQPKFPFVPGYDLVGRVVAVGSDIDPSLIGKRFAVLTLKGGWATYGTVPVEDLLPIPEGIDPVKAETLIVNGITAWQMLHRHAKIKKGQTILVHGANGGVGTILTQLAQIAGVGVIGTSSSKHHENLRRDGVIPVDYNDKNLAQSVRNISPGGVDAVFDNIGGKSIDVSFSLLKKGGTLVGYAMMSESKNKNIMMLQFVILLIKVICLNILPNGRNANFYYIWSGKGTEKFRGKMQEDFKRLMDLLSELIIKPQIAATFPLTQIARAMEFAESRTAYGKVVLIP